MVRVSVVPRRSVCDDIVMMMMKMMMIMIAEFTTVC